jgi:diazepam-binding inhibitor (GABA receptor modulating acyl-CoA-binding protein)
MFDLKGKYKWEAWDSNKGKSKEDAQKQYVTFVQELKAKQ